MLQIEHNDHLTQLTLINNLSNESLVVVDDFKVYGSISYNPFEPTKTDLLQLWQKALEEYLNLNGHNPVLREWRQNTFNASIEAFKQSDIYKETEE